MSAAKEYYEWLAASAKRYEALAKSLVKHHAEKGRVVEGVVKAALRAFLPGRFSLGTGFIVAASGEPSPQIDVVIYDAFQNAPLLLESGAGIFPIECVYGFVEVKSNLRSADIASTMSAIAKVRRLAPEKRYVSYAVGGKEDEPVSLPTGVEYTLPPRSYLFALRSEISSSSLLPTLIQRSGAEPDAHIHGLAVMEPEIFATQRAYSTPPAFSLSPGDAMVRFAGAVLDGVQSVGMWPAEMGRYLGR